MNTDQDYYNAYCHDHGTYDDASGPEVGFYEEQVVSSPFKDDFYSYDDDENSELSF